MPELPEVETTRRSLEAPLVGRRVTHVVVRDRRLRWPIEPDFERHLTGASIRAVGRRAKYLLVVTDRGTAMIHLGMSGSLVRVAGTTPVVKHDHVDIGLDDGGVLRFHDPRRFGSIHWIDGDPASHPLLASLAPEPSDAVVRRRVAPPHHPRAQRRDQARPDERPARHGRRQHLRVRGTARGGDRSEDGGEAAVARALRPARRVP
jgi:DNA-formamidopyrimidine glycosylase